MKTIEASPSHKNNKAIIKRFDFWKMRGTASRRCKLPKATLDPC